MATPSILDQSVLAKLLRYEPETGNLYWLVRPREYFGCARICASWNATYAGKQAFTATTTSGYKYGNIFNHKFPAHRVIWCLVHGAWPEFVDHIDGDRVNNRINNLRSVTQSENMRNSKRHSRNRSGVMGVFFDARTKQWQAQIYDNGKTTFLGRRTSFDDAVALRKQAELRLGYHPNHGR